jgi:hypothetical protein
MSIVSIVRCMRTPRRMASSGREAVGQDGFGVKIVGQRDGEKEQDERATHGGPFAQ